MDTKEKDYDADALLAELRESLKNINEPKVDSIEINLSSSDNDTFGDLTSQDNGYYYSSSGTDTITLSPSYSNTIIGGGFTAGTGISSGPFTVTGVNGATYPNSVWTTTASNSMSGQINLDGDEADIKINGKSLCDAITRLEERLNILNINPELEAEWAELKELGDKYRALEAKLKEQGEMWEKLKSMPPPKPLY